MKPSPGPDLWPLDIQDDRLVDPAGRTVIMRGINLAGSSKLPADPDGSSYRPESLKRPETVSFVGRPFPLEEADEHYSRIAAWGFKFLRFIITWEAVEHAGPGKYDRDYLSYLEAVVAKAGEHGLGVWIDPHQDVWSRWTGGDGAPAWTLELAGMDLQKIVPAGAAVVHALFEGEGALRDQIHRIERAQAKNIPLGESIREGIKDSLRDTAAEGPEPPKTYPSMIWPTNYTRFACSTMFALFFGGSVYAPSFTVDGRNIQELLQERYFRMIEKVAGKLKKLPHVIGFGSMNEPHRGYIGWKDLNRPSEWLMKNGPTPTGIEGMAAASGCKRYVRFYRFTSLGPIASGYTFINKNEESLWKPGCVCPWRREGVWDMAHDKPVLLKPHYFASLPGGPGGPEGSTVSFSRDFLKPFLKRFYSHIEKIDRRFLVFIEAIPSEPHPSWDPEEDGDRAVNGSHWYDAHTLITKRHAPRIAYDTVSQRPVFGKKRVRRSFIRQIRHQVDAAEYKMGGIPTVIGEFGVPFDLKSSNGFETGDYSDHEAALDSYYRAMEANRIGAFLWNYCPDNVNLLGDRWNDEDLSVYSLDGGARGTAGFVRPYPLAIFGTVEKITYDRRRRIFELEVRGPGAVESKPAGRAKPGLLRRGGAPDIPPSLIFVPRDVYPEELSVQLSTGAGKYSRESQILTVTGVDPAARLTLRITPA